MHTEKRLVVFASCIAITLTSLRYAKSADVVEVNTCGVTFSESTSAYLSGDLDCSSWSESGGQAAISFVRKGTLDLRGFTLTGPLDRSDVITAAVRCGRNCTILGGGGSIVGGGIGVEGLTYVRIASATIRGSALRAVAAHRSLRIEDVTITDNYTHAITATLRATIERSSITENGGKVRPSTGAVEKTSAVIFSSGKIRLLETTVHSNGWAGMEAWKITARDSSVFGNGLFPECGVTRNCRFDVGSEKPVRFENTACDVSLDLESCGCDGDSAVTPETDPALHNWGICAQD